MASLGYTMVLDWKTKHPGNRKQEALWDVFLLNTNRIIEMRADRSFWLASFWFSNNPNDSRDSPDWLHVFWSPDVWEAWHNLDPASKFGTFPIFPDFDRTQTPIDTDIQWENVAYIYCTYQEFYHYDTCHMVYYTDSWKRVECIVDMTMGEIMTMEDAS